jgi:hypothetical protein
LGRRIQRKAGIPTGVAAELAGLVAVLRPVLQRREIEGHALCRQIDQPGHRIERHRMPVMSAEWTGNAVHSLFGIARCGNLDRASVGVIPRRPIHLDEVLRRNKFAVGAIDHEEEAVLRRVKNDFLGAPSILMSARIIGCVDV